MAHEHQHPAPGAAHDSPGGRPAVEMSGVSFQYNGAPVVQDVDLVIEAGRFAVLVGPNGGGKTTLIKLMLGLLSPDRGRVRVLGKSPRKARPRVGYVPQHQRMDPRFPVTVNDVVLMGRLGRTRSFGPYSAEDRDAAAQALARLDIEHLAGRSFSALSGGQRQRVLIARAMVSSPDLLLLDEPAAGMDVVGEHELLDILNGLNRTITVVLVTHDLGLVSSHFETAICVNRKVVVHPTRLLNGSVISDLYGQPVRMVAHNHHLPAGEGA